MFGKYLATHPFGTVTLTLNRDGTFEQRAVIAGEKPLTVRGSWRFDKNGDVDVYGALVVADGFGDLRPDWKEVERSLIGLPVERLWFRVTLSSGAQHPYLKQ